MKIMTMNKGYFLPKIGLRRGSKGSFSPLVSLGKSPRLFPARSGSLSGLRQQSRYGLPLCETCLAHCLPGRGWVSGFAPRSFGAYSQGNLSLRGIILRMCAETRGAVVPVKGTTKKKKLPYEGRLI